jgi:PAS domain S-box-containing protein
MHAILRRQLNRLHLRDDTPPTLAQWRALLDRVDKFYEQADQDRYTLERSLQVSSEEMKQLYLEGKAANETELARERDKLRALNWFLDSIVESIPDMVFVKDAASLEFVRVNRAGEALLGIAREELLGRGDHDFFPKEEADAFIAKDREVLAEKRLALIEEEAIATRHLGRRLLCTTKIPILDERGQPAYLLGISRDVTEKRDTQARLERAAEHERASRAKSAFLANMSHELRTPLNAIIGFSEMLEDRVPGPLNDKQERYVSHVLSSARHLLRLIGEILDLS